MLMVPSVLGSAWMKLMATTVETSSRTTSMMSDCPDATCVTVYEPTGSSPRQLPFASVRVMPSTAAAPSVSAALMVTWNSAPATPWQPSAAAWSDAGSMYVSSVRVSPLVGHWPWESCTRPTAGGGTGSTFDAMWTSVTAAPAATATADEAL